MTEHVVATVTITKTMTDDNVDVYCEAVDPAGEPIALIDAIALLEFAKHALLTD